MKINNTINLGNIGQELYDMLLDNEYWVDAGLVDKKFSKYALIAKDIFKFLLENNLLNQTRIYFDNHCLCSRNGLSENIKASDYFEYANDNTLSMSFEGPLYDVLNEPYFQCLEEEFSNIFKTYGSYYELGNNWNLSVYEIREV